MKRITASLIVVGLLLVPAYAASGAQEITPEDIAAADARRRAVGAELGEATAAYEEAVSRNTTLLDQLRRVAADIAVAERILAELRIEAENVARTMYMEVGASPAVTALDAESINELPIREGYLSTVSRSGQETLSRLMALEDAYADQQELLASLQEDQEETVAELDELAAGIVERLVQADQEYQNISAAYEAQEAEKRRKAEEERRRREEEERRRATSTTTQAPNGDDGDGGDGGGGDTTTTQAPDDDGGGGGDDTTTTQPPDNTTTTTAAPPPPPPKGGRACPVKGAVTFTDTYGAPRSGGRRHQGVDMIAQKGTPVVALEGGSVSLKSSTLGGITIYLYGKSGDTFYYAHLDGYASGIGSGDSVSAGELIGYVGNSGNARYTVSHLHFEYHPGGGGAANPTPLVRGLC